MPFKEQQVVQNAKPLPKCSNLGRGYIQMFLRIILCIQRQPFPKFRVVMMYAV